MSGSRARRIAVHSDGLGLGGELLLPARHRLITILCHGIPSGNPPEPGDLGYAGLAREFAARGFAAMWFDFRGARSSPGDFSVAGWARDLASALDALAGDRDVAGLPRVVVGSSAGGAVAIDVAARRADVAAVATLAAPAVYDFSDYGGDAEGVLLRLKNVGLVRDPGFPPDIDAWWHEFDERAPVHHVRRIAPRPLLLVQGDADEVVPPHHAERLFELAGEPKELVRLAGGTHQLRKDPRAIDAVCDWLANLPG